jgi:hypothetical protein
MDRDLRRRDPDHCEGQTIVASFREVEEENATSSMMMIKRSSSSSSVATPRTMASRTHNTCLIQELEAKASPAKADDRPLYRNYHHHYQQ